MAGKEDGYGGVEAIVGGDEGEDVNGGGGSGVCVCGLYICGVGRADGSVQAEHSIKYRVPNAIQSSKRTGTSTE